MTLDKKVAIVTGAGGAIGRAIAAAMAAAGASVVIDDVGVSLSGEGGSATPVQETQALIHVAGGNAVISTDSVCEWAAAQHIAGNALDAFGRLDIVINNAGILRDEFFHETIPEQWSSVVNVHLNGSFLVSRAAADVLRRQESGVYVHMTSTSGLIGNVGQANYGGALRNVGVETLGSAVTKAVLERTGLDPARIEEVIFAQSYANRETPCVGRWIALEAGLPIAVPGLQIDRRCGRGQGMAAIVERA